MAETRAPDETLVRELVERALAAADASAAAPPAASGAGTTSPTAATVASAPVIPGLVQPLAGSPTSVAIGADHGGVTLKAVLAKHLADRGFGVTDCGTTGTDAVDYPDFAHVVARLVAPGSGRRGTVSPRAGVRV